MDTPVAAPRTWVLHDGELADVRALLKELGADVTEAVNGWSGDPAVLSTADLVVATARRALQLPQRGWEGEKRAVLIVVQDWDSRSLAEPSHADFLLRRPFHPTTLRLLVLRALYRGPERRRSERAAIGATVRFRAGLWRRSATLVELSMGGCRLLSRHAVKGGQRITILLPAELAEGQELALPGRVVRFSSGEDADFESQTIGVEFEPFPNPTWQRLSAVIARHVPGTRALPGSRSEDETRGDSGPTAPPVSEKTQPGAAPVACRRRAPRRSYPRRVIALGTGSARVLTGRDLSLGGMRADPNPHLSLGDELRLALHVRPGFEPLVVRARVARDDGKRGLVLQFREISPAAAQYLQKMLDVLPPLGSSESETSEGQAHIVAEIVESRRA